MTNCRTIGDVSVVCRYKTAELFTCVVYSIGTGSCLCTCSQPVCSTSLTTTSIISSERDYRLNYSTYVKFKGTAKSVSFMYSFGVYAKWGKLNQFIGVFLLKFSLLPIGQLQPLTFHPMSEGFEKFYTFRYALHEKKLMQYCTMPTLIKDITATCSFIFIIVKLFTVWKEISLRKVQ
jgi:hypothetical protein